MNDLFTCQRCKKRRHITLAKWIDGLIACCYPKGAGLHQCVEGCEVPDYDAYPCWVCKKIVCSDHSGSFNNADMHAKPLFVRVCCQCIPGGD